MWYLIEFLQRLLIWAGIQVWPAAEIPMLAAKTPPPITSNKSKIKVKYSWLPDRNHCCREIKAVNDIPPVQDFFKPQGLWYGIKDSWITWQDYSYDNPDGNPDALVTLHQNLYAVEIAAFTTLDAPDPTKILMISTPADYLGLMAFVETAPDWNAEKFSYWGYVAKYFAGVEFRNLDPHELGISSITTRHPWIFGIDVESGCVWNTVAIKRFELVYMNLRE